MADSINSLPTDKNAPTHPELQIVDYLGLEVSLKEKSPFPVFEDIING